MSWSGLFSLPAFAEKAKSEQKHCILLWLCGAPSQFETWDPEAEQHLRRSVQEHSHEDSRACISAN